MADDKTRQGSADRAQVAGDEPYEVDYFARKHGLTHDDAQALIDRVGNDREALNAAAEQQAGTQAPAKPRARSKPSGKTTGKAADISANTKPATARKTSARKSQPATKTARAIDAVSAAVVEPVIKAAKPVKRKAVAATRGATGAAGKRVATVERKIAEAPAAARKRGTDVAAGIKSAVPGRAASLFGAAAAGIAAGLALNLGRKVVVQAPSALTGDWFEAVKAEHRVALGLFDAMQATTADDARKRSTLLAQLKHALGKHAFTEENVLYPALREWGDKADADKLNHDHGYVKQYLYDLEEMDKASPGFPRLVAEFREQIEAHIREEEDAIFPPLHAALDDAKNAKLTALANKEGFKLA